MTEHRTPEKGSGLGTPRILLSHSRRVPSTYSPCQNHVTGWQLQVWTTQYLRVLKASLTAKY